MSTLTLEPQVHSDATLPAKSTTLLDNAKQRTMRVLIARAGGMADALILASRRLAPQRLIETGYVFRFAELEAALRHELAPAA